MSPSRTNPRRVSCRKCMSWRVYCFSADQQQLSMAWMVPTWGQKPCLPDNISLCCGRPSTPWQKGQIGLKLNLYAIIMRTLKSLKGMYAEVMEVEKWQELDKFANAYKFRSREMYTTAQYQAVVQSMDKARHPSSLPEE